ncbi:MAG: DUF3492 domain-containing protein, partial [Acidimicrobiales bacterium]
MRILLTTEGTYPYTKGGVSTWTHSLVSGLPHHEFSLMALTANPIAQPIFPVPPNVKLMPVPLWGSELVEEYLDRPHGLRRRLRTKPEIVKSRFLPVFEHLVNELVIANPDLDAVGTCLVAIAQFSQPYDLCQALHDERVWSLLLARFQGNPAYQHTGVGEAVDLARSFYRYLMPLASPLPEVDIVHSSAAALCAFPALIAKITRGTPFVLTEHGVYLRERLLDLVRSKTPTLEKILFSNFFRGIVLAAYRNADRIVPVCYYNAKWEMELGVEAEGVSVIHNGVDPAHFPKGHGDPARPTVAYVGRIDPLKDIVT